MAVLMAGAEEISSGGIRNVLLLLPIFFLGGVAGHRSWLQLQLCFYPKTLFSRCNPLMSSAS
jgi:hypothetical protein